MAILRAQAVFPMHTGFARDVITNTVHFSWDESGPYEEAVDEVGVRLDAFFTGIYAGTGRAANYVQWNVATVEVINYEDTPPRIPQVRDMGIGVSALASTIPTEAAAVMTYASAETGGIIRQRLYNRIYLGGLGPNCITGSTSSTYPTIAVAFRDAIALAAGNLHTANDGFLDWIQYSPTSGAARAITRGWIDNTPDTQRRRGVDDTARTPILF